jgi:molecular chaperone DnaJ
VLRHGPDLSDRTTISDVFEIRDRLQQTVRFV